MPKPRRARCSSPRKSTSSSGRRVSAPARSEEIPLNAETHRSFQILSEAHTRMSDKVVLLSKLLHLFSDTVHVDRAMERAVDLALEAVPCEAASILLVDAQQGDLFFQATRGPVAVEVKQYRVPLGVGIAGSAVQEHRSFAVSDVSKEPRFFREISKALGFKCRSVLGVPIIHQGEAYGVIELINKIDGNVFQAQEVENVEMVARAAASLLAIARRLAPAAAAEETQGA